MSVEFICGAVEMDTLVTAEWLKQHINDPDLVILDCSVVTMPDETDPRGMSNVSGRPDYELGHIPNAGFADLKTDLCRSNGPIEFDLLSPEQFCAAMGALGVNKWGQMKLLNIWGQSKNS